MPAMKDEESILLASTLNTSQANSQECDDNQNNMNNRVVSNVNGGAGIASDRIRVNLKQLLALYAKLKRQLVEFTEAKANEQSSYKAKCDEMSSQVINLRLSLNVSTKKILPFFQLISLQLDIESRPTQEDFDEKVQQCNALRSELSNLTEQMTCNEKLLDQMQDELSEARDRQMEMLEKCLLDHSAQTEEIESTKEVPAAQNVSIHKSSVLSESPPVVGKEPRESSTETPPSSSSTASLHVVDGGDDDALNNHPKVLYEDELIVFKEKCTNLTTENIRLHREISELRTNMSHFHNNWLHNFMIKYLVPVLIVFVAYMFYMLK